ncbi:MAG TPA: hydrogenase maturation protease [Candidatus Margulisiibacteriota bacterium]|nr:hydrogenase maturation protease [Candidatus Margulisiibacteriota bacterium]
MERNSSILAHLASHLKGKIVILGIGNNLKSDDGIGSILAGRIQGKVPYLVYDSGSSPENYLGKIVRDKPDTLLLIDAVDFSAPPGDFNILEGDGLQAQNMCFTHNASLSLVINYLKNNLKVDIIILIIQPKTLAFGDSLSPEVSKTLKYLEDWFIYGHSKKEG